ncbi:MAG: hypothetical protein PHF67_04415 [Candidatus Nanoarchaeia archaeon]|nr:hypothetical protein [Candidatus Nanoarchaeia archaeon]
MRNIIVISEDSGLAPRRYKKALESLAHLPLDILNVSPEIPAKVYPKLKLTSKSPQGGINWSHLSFCRESTFYQMIFHGQLRLNNEPSGKEGYLVYDGGKRVLEVYYYPHHDFPAMRRPSNFIFYLECKPEQLLGPDGTPLFSKH